MSKVGTKQHVFEEIANANIRGEIDIDEMRELYEREGFWTAEEAAKADREWKNSDLRRRARQPIYDDDGSRRELVNVKRARAASVEKQQFFMWLDETTKEDLEWLIEDRIDKRNYFDSEAARLLSVYSGRFGKRASKVFQKRLNLKEHPAEAN